MNCANAVTECQSPTTPLIGYVAEATDPAQFIGLGFSNVTPPLGWSFLNPSCLQIVTSPVSQSDADAAALAQANQCAMSQWFSPDGAPAALPLPPPLFPDPENETNDLPFGTLDLTGVPPIL